MKPRIRLAPLCVLLAGFLLATFSIATGEESLEYLRIGIVADVHAHDVDSPAEGKFMVSYPERLSAFVDAMNAWPADFVIELGDFVNGWLVLGAPLGDPGRIPCILEEADKIYAGFNGPRYHVIGNHDVYNLTKEQYVECLGMQGTYYSFDTKSYHIVALDVQFDEKGNDLANTYTGVSGFVPTSELAWLRADLSSTDKPTVVCVHQMLDLSVEEWGRSLVANAQEVRDILAKSGVVIAVFQGHDHDNGHSFIDGVHYVTFEALVDQRTPSSWAMVTLDPVARTIVIEGEGEQADWQFEY